MWLTSCSTYQSTSVSLSQAVDKGKVKTISSLGESAYFKNVVFVDSTYYGVNGKDRVILNKVAVPTVYLSALYNSKEYKIWLKPIDSNIKIIGLLYAVQDSSLIILQNSSSQKPEEITNQRKIEVSNIETIRIREKGKVGRGYLKGTFIAMGIGATVGLVAGIGSENGAGVTIAVMGIGAGLLGPIGSLIGLAAGSSSDHYRINGKQRNFNNYKAILNERSIN